MASSACDLLVFSGDLAYHGTAEELRMGLHRLITPTMNTLGLGPDRVVIIPGNHDVNRKLISPIVEAGLASSLDSRDAVAHTQHSQADRDLALTRLQEWTAFADG